MHIIDFQKHKSKRNFFLLQQHDITLKFDQVVLFYSVYLSDLVQFNFFYLQNSSFESQCLKTLDNKMNIHV